MFSPLVCVNNTHKKNNEYHESVFRHTEAESQIEEISGVAFFLNQKLFNYLNEAKRIGEFSY